MKKYNLVISEKHFNSFHSKYFTNTFTGDENVTGDSQYSNENFNKICFNICETGSIDENGVQNLSIYPNPTSNQWTIDSEDNEILSIEIYSIQGALIFSETANSKKVRVDASNYVPGMYILKATTTNGIVSKRVFKN